MSSRISFASVFAKAALGGYHRCRLTPDWGRSISHTPQISLTRQQSGRPIRAIVPLATASANLGISVWGLATATLPVSGTDERIWYWRSANLYCVPARVLAGNSSANSVELFEATDGTSCERNRVPRSEEMTIQGVLEHLLEYSFEKRILAAILIDGSRRANSQPGGVETRTPTPFNLADCSSRHPLEGGVAAGGKGSILITTIWIGRTGRRSLETTPGGRPMSSNYIKSPSR